jgi:hypothetical protein
LVILIILGEEYKLWCSSLCSFLQPPVPSSSSVQMFSSVPCSQTSSVCVPPFMSDPCPIWPPVLPLNLTYILVFLSQLSWGNLPYRDLSNFTHKISCPFSLR